MTTDLFLQQFEDDLTSALTNAYEDIGWTQPVKAKLGNGAGVVIVPPADAKFPGALYAYNTDNGGRKNVFQVVNSHAGIPYNNDWAETRIKLAYPPGERQYLHIVWIDMEGLYQTKGMMPSQYEHEINKYLSPERWTPLRITAGTGLGLNLIGGWFQAGLALVYLPNTTGIIDMTSHRPSTSNMARYCMVYYDPASDTFGTVDGDDFDNAEQVEIETFMPTTVPAGAMVLGHVRLHQGQTGWGDSDIVRPALPFFTPPGIVPPQLGGGGFDLTTIQGFLFYNGVNTYQVHCVGDQIDPPTVNHDETSTPHPFGVLSLWVTSVTAGASENAVYMCVDPTAAAAVWLRLDGASGGTMDDFTVAADSGIPAVISDGETVTFAGSGGLATVISGNTVFTDLPSNAVTNAKLADMAALTVKARVINSVGDPSDLAFTADGQFLVRRAGALVPDTIAAGDLPNHSAALITSGTLALARGGTGADLSATGGTGQYVKQSSAGAAFTVGTIPAADIPNLAASIITSGTFDNARINWAAPSAIGGTTPAAGTFSALTVTATAPEMVITGTVNNTRAFYWRTSGTNRWVHYVGAGAESGSNVNSDYFIGAYSDGGTFLGNYLVITRASGKVTLSGELQIGGALNHDGTTIGFNGSTPVAKGTITGSRNNNEALQSLLDFLESRGDIIDSTTASG